MVFIIVLAVCGCARLIQGGSMVGKWQLIETLADPGDGSGKWNLSPDNSSYLTFNADGSVNGSSDVNYIAYTLPGDNKIEFTSKDNRKQTVSYSISGDTLTIRPQCIEACGFKYLRSK